MKHRPQQWRVLTMEVDKAHAELVTAILLDYEISGIEQRDGCAGMTCLCAYFAPHVHTVDAAADRLKSDIPQIAIHGETVAWDPNDEAWRLHFRPFAIVPGIVIAPSWERYRPAPNERVITLDPGMAFGTGLHATTSMCAGMIARQCRSKSAPDSMLDVGCGSGILSLIARRLGIARIAAVENDAEAALIARTNFVRNDASDITVSSCIGEIGERYGLVVANILFATLIDLCDELYRAAEDGGLIVISGITDEQTDAIISAYAAIADIVETIGQDEWRCMVFRR